MVYSIHARHIYLSYLLQKAWHRCVGVADVCVCACICVCIHWRAAPNTKSVCFHTGCGTALRAEVAGMVQWLARIGVLREPNDIGVWRDWLLEGLFRQVAHAGNLSGYQVCLSHLCFT